MNILIIDDEANIRRTVEMYLKSNRHVCKCAASFNEALNIGKKNRFDMAFLDLRLGDDNGLDLIAPLLEENPDLKIVVMTAYSTIESAVNAMKLGAFDYIGKPFNPAQIDVIIAKAEKLFQMENRLSLLNADLQSLHPDGIFDSKSPEMVKLLTLSRQVAASDAIILLRGESGCGKTVLAKAIHQWSRRRDAPFGVVSCPTLSGELLSSELFGHVKGAFTGAVKDQVGRVESCDKGTLFLDEIGDLPLSIQPKLLRFIQDREYEKVGDCETKKSEVRIIAATNLDLDEAVKAKRFREDLFFRLNVFELHIPPLRERCEDIPLLAENMLRFFARNNHKAIERFSDSAMEILLQYNWPGNLRELRNAVERAVIIGNQPVLAPECLPQSICRSNFKPEYPANCTLEELEKQHIERMIRRCGSLQEAAEALGIDLSTLWRKRKQYGL